MQSSPFGSASGKVLTLAMDIGKSLGFSRAIARLMIRQLRSPALMSRAFAGYLPTEHDVFVATFGKSGTNWMMQIAQQIAHRGQAEFEHIHDVVAWPDAPGGASSRIISLQDPGSRQDAPTQLRVIKTHLATDFVPYCDHSTYLTVLRDPKEVLVSSYFFLGGLLGVLSHLSIDDWFELFARPDSMASGWAAHTASYWAWRQRENVLVLGYAEILRDPGRAIAQVAAAMGVELTDAEFARVAERSSFAYMKAHEYQFAPPRSPFAKDDEAPLMIRRGESGRSDEKLSATQRSAIDGICRAELRRLGSDFPYDRFFDLSS